MRAACVVVVAVLGSAALLQPQVPKLSPEALRAVDSALALLGVSRQDWWLPGDVGEVDQHRLPAVRALFREPFSSFEFATRQAEQLLALRPATLDATARQWSELLAFGEYTPRYYEQQLSAHQVDSLLGVELERRLGLIAATSLRQYLVPLVLAWREISQVRSSFRSFPLLVELLDSLLMLSEDESQASLFELRQRELWGLQRAREYFQVAAEVPWYRLLAPMLSLWRAIWATVERNSPPLDRYRDSVRTTILETPYGRIAVGGPGEDTYVGDFTLILEVGGNDRYVFPKLSKSAALERPVRIVVDLAGDDSYDGGDYTLGAGFFGCGFLIDLQGNDIYRSRHFSQGAALAGLGFLWDGGGADLYACGVHGQGAAAFGIGLLMDGGGNDLYRCFAQGQGFGFVRGYGALVDRSGNDSYIAQSPYVDALRYDQRFLTFTQGAALGYRLLASGGIGILLDSAGNDTYVSDIYGQGTAYWYAMGALLDWQGDDRYVAHQYAQGAGVHLAFGLLWDAAGSDVYLSFGVSQGCGHDIALGALYDAAGDDTYACESLSQGAANANGLALLLDLHGRDTYVARRDNTMGYGDFRRQYGSIGVFADAEGTDWYADTALNRRSRMGSTYGALLDAELLPPLPPPPRPGIDVPDSLRMPLAEGIDSLFAQASAAHLRFQYIVQPAREKIAKLGAATLPYLAAKFATESVRERIALEDILTRIDQQDSAALRRLIVDSLRSKNERTLALMGTVAGKLRLKAALPALAELLEDSRWYIRAMAALRIGEIGDTSVQRLLRRSLNDAHPMVRARAAFALVRLWPRQPRELWLQVLQDSFYVVRSSAILGALQYGSLPRSLLEELWDLPLPRKWRRSLGWLVLGADTTAPIRRVAQLLLRQPAELRQVAYVAISQQRATPWRERLRVACARQEPDAELRRILSPASR
ncbi:MAG: HEAT repeat domain-containing protein [Chlorobiota bacterium]